MTDTSIDPVDTAQAHAEESWEMFAQGTGLTDTAITWEKTQTPDGGTLLSGQLDGPRTVWALERFTRDFHLTIPYAGDMRPQADLTQPGRTVLVWRYGGVWVELWHPERAVDAPQAPPVPSAPAQAAQAASEAPKPSPPPSMPAARRAFLLLRPSGRLPFTRNRRPLTRDAS